ncbi:MAG: hypothetical protein AAGH19_08700 [Pseudomonadota bacterium]
MDVAAMKPGGFLCEQCGLAGTASDQRSPNDGTVIFAFDRLTRNAIGRNANEIMAFARCADLSAATQLA